MAQKHVRIWLIVYKVLKLTDFMMNEDHWHSRNFWNKTCNSYKRHYTEKDQSKSELMFPKTPRWGFFTPHPDILRKFPKFYVIYCIFFMLRVPALFPENPLIDKNGLQVEQFGTSVSAYRMTT